jgi:SnoaL-like domain
MDSGPRSTRDVLASHLQLRRAGRLEEDLRTNYADDVVVLTSSGVWRGHDGLRDQARALSATAPAQSFEYGEVVVAGEIGYLEWRAHADDTVVHDGADSYLVRGGRIVAQTIHYAVRGDGEPDGPAA